MARQMEQSVPSESPESLLTSGRWEHFDHQADIGVRGRGATKADAFAQAARALTAVLTDPDRIGTGQRVQIECRAPDDEFLLVDWLNRIVYEMATRRMLFGQFKVAIEGDRLTAEAIGEPVDALRHAPAVEVKGATYTAAKVGPEPDGSWVAQCVVDV